MSIRVGIASRRDVLGVTLWMLGGGVAMGSLSMVLLAFYELCRQRMRSLLSQMSLDYKIHLVQALYEVHEPQALDRSQKYSGG